MKKVLTILILFTLVLFVVSPAFAETNQPPQMQPPIKFNDLGDYKWGIDAVDRMAAKGVIKGVGNNKFAPASPVTHLEVLAFLIRLINPYTNPGTTYEYYKELVNKYQEWGTDVILQAEDYGLFSYDHSYTNGFDFNKLAKRYEIVEYLIRALKLTPFAYINADKQQQFSDWGSIPKGYNGFLYEAVNQWLFKGNGKALKPLDNVKRIEIAVLLDRLDQFLKNPSKEYYISYIIYRATNIGLPPEWVLAMIDASGSNYNPKYKQYISDGSYLAGVTGINKRLLPEIAEKTGIEYKEGMEFDAITNMNMVIDYLYDAYVKHQDLQYVSTVYQNGFERTDKLVANNTLYQYVGEYDRILNEGIAKWKKLLEEYTNTEVNM